MLNFLGREKGMVIHGCGIEIHGKGILFVGESGAGKSTLAKLWDQQNTAKVLSDDRIIVRKIGDTFRMYGTPWHGESHFVSPRSVALEKMYFLRHGSQNEIRSLNGAAPVQQLLQCSFPPFWDAKGMEFALQYFSRLVSSVPCFDFSFTADKSAIEYLALEI